MKIPRAKNSMGYVKKSVGFLFRNYINSYNLGYKEA